MFIQPPLPSLQEPQNLKHLNMRHVNMRRLTDSPQRVTLSLVKLIPMGPSEAHTLVLGIAYPSTILNTVWRDIILTSLNSLPLNNTLEDAYLWIMPMYICALNIKWGYNNLKPLERNRHFSDFLWIIVSFWIHNYPTMEFFMPKHFFGTYMKMLRKSTTVE